MKKLVLCACILSLAFCLIACGSKNNSGIDEQLDSSAGTVCTGTDILTEEASSEDTNRELLETCDNWHLFDLSMELATEKQREKLQGIQNDCYFGSWGAWYIREIKRIMGLIPEDSPYITKETMQSLVTELQKEGLLDDYDHNIYLIRDRMNQIALAPDVDGEDESGSVMVLYSVDKEHTGYIELHSTGGIRYHNLADNSWEVLFQPDGLVDKRLKECDDWHLYDLSMAVGTEEQKQQLSAIRDNLYFGDNYKLYTREIKRIMGLIPEDAPYLTVEVARAMIQEMQDEGLIEFFFNDIYKVRDRFNQYAYAPDVDGGSGAAIIWYSVNAEHTEFIELHMMAGIRYYNKIDGTEIWLYQPVYEE